MAVKKGYKQTEVGVIPSDWEVCQVSKLVRSGPKNGYSGRSGLEASGTATLSLSATTSGKLILNSDTVKYLEASIPPESDLFLKPDDVLVQRSNTIELVGTTAVFTGPLNFCIYPDLMMRLRFRNRVLAQWFWRYANSLAGRSYFRSSAAGSTGSMPKLSGHHLRDMPIPLPPTLAEQEAIAGALSDADAWIESLEQLIAKKRQIKQGAMQELLTGKRRLPGFSGKWETKRLGDVANVKTGSKNNEDKVDDGEFPFFVRSDTVERINTFSHDCEAILVPGEGRIGDIFHYISGRFDVHQRVYAITRFVETVSPRFLYFYLKKSFGVWAMQNTVKATVDSLRLPTFTCFEMKLPSSLQEQTAIAKVLSDMDTEIEALESKLAKAREIKQGMMQELLTGRIRLIEN